MSENSKRNKGSICSIFGHGRPVQHICIPVFSKFKSRKTLIGSSSYKIGLQTICVAC